MRVGPLGLDHGLPSDETRQKLYDELDFQRATLGVRRAESRLCGSYRMPTGCTQ
jgi:hypothetical protein